MSLVTSVDYDELVSDEYFSEEDESDDRSPSSECGDYSPLHPWDAPGMSIYDFI